MYLEVSRMLEFRLQAEGPVFSMTWNYATVVEEKDRNVDFFRLPTLKTWRVLKTGFILSWYFSCKVGDVKEVLLVLTSYETERKFLTLDTQ